MKILLVKIVVPLLLIQLVTAYPRTGSQLHRPPPRPPVGPNGKDSENIESREKREENKLLISPNGKDTENIESREKRSALGMVPPTDSQLPPGTLPTLPPLIKKLLVLEDTSYKRKMI